MAGSRDGHRPSLKLVGEGPCISESERGPVASSRLIRSERLMISLGSHQRRLPARCGVPTRTRGRPSHVWAPCHHMAAIRFSIRVGSGHRRRAFLQAGPTVYLPTFASNALSLSSISPVAVTFTRAPARVAMAVATRGSSSPRCTSPNAHSNKSAIGRSRAGSSFPARTARDLPWPPLRRASWAPASWPIQ